MPCLRKLYRRSRWGDKMKIDIAILKENQLRETYYVDEYQGIVGLMSTIRKEGYVLESVYRLKEKADVVWRKVK
jgi:hypothetical protein